MQQTIMSLKRNKSEENLRNTLFSSPLISARKQDCEGVRREQFESACFVDFYTRRGKTGDNIIKATH